MKKRYILALLFVLLLLALTLRFWLLTGNKGSIDFDFCVFVIISVLSYLFSLKCLDYLASFKYIKQQSRIEIVFLLIFFILLFIPMSHINTSKVSKRESRSLAKWNSLITSNYKINYNFGKDFDNWYNDRFFTREGIVFTYDYMRYKIAFKYYETKKGFLNKSNNWMSANIGFNNEDRFSNDEKAIIVNNIKKLKQFSNNNNIKFYILIAPRKEEICLKELSPLLKNASKYEKTLDMIEYIKKETGVDVIYPYKAIENLQKNDFAYFKADHHWTDEGAYLGYLKLMGKIKQDFPKIYVAPRKDFNFIYTNKIRVNPRRGFFEGRTYEIMNLHDKKLLDVKYKYFKHRNENKRAFTAEQHLSQRYSLYSYTYDSTAPNMTLFGDSFTLNLLPTITYSFNNTNNIYTYVSAKEDLPTAFSIKRFEKDILKNNPQVLIICLSEIYRLEFLYGEND